MANKTSMLGLKNIMSVSITRPYLHKKNDIHPPVLGDFQIFSSNF